MTAVAATRSNLMQLRRRLDQVDKGAALLRKKRESLVKELMGRARSAVDRRQELERQALISWKAALDALALQGAPGLTAQGWPTRALKLELEPIEVWGVRATALTHRPSLVRSLAARGVAPGEGDAAAQTAAGELERLLEQLIEHAPAEHLMRRLGQALARATRLVNTLEQRVSVSLSKELSTLRRTLDEREREEHLRLQRLVARRRH